MMFAVDSPLKVVFSSVFYPHPIDLCLVRCCYSQLSWISQVQEPNLTDKGCAEACEREDALGRKKGEGVFLKTLG